MAIIMIWFCIPETKALSLEELDFVFAVPTKQFGSYQTSVWLPYAFKRYILRRDVARPAPLYNFDDIAGARTYNTAVAH